jgi:hypothetical protein
LSKLFIEEAMDKGFKRFVSMQEELLGVQGISSEWKAELLFFVQKRTCASPWFKPLLILLCLFL